MFVQYEWANAKLQKPETVQKVVRIRVILKESSRLYLSVLSRREKHVIPPLAVFCDDRSTYLRCAV